MTTANSQLRPKRSASKGFRSGLLPDVDSLIAGRRQLMDEIARLRGWKVCAIRYLDQAESLLTTQWRSATWTARSSLLRSSQWLVRLVYDEGICADARRDRSGASTRPAKTDR
jgi:hypothetical protein